MKRKVISGIAYDKVKGYQLRARCLGCSFTGNKRFHSHCLKIPVEVCNEKDQPIWVRSQVQPKPVSSSISDMKGLNDLL